MAMQEKRIFGFIYKEFIINPLYQKHAFIEIVTVIEKILELLIVSFLFHKFNFLNFTLFFAFFIIVNFTIINVF